MNTKPIDHSSDVEDELPSELDFSKLTPIGRGLYAERYNAGHNIRLLDGEIAQEFPTSESVNEALRDYLRIKAKSA